jgi:hypothetical protein
MAIKLAVEIDGSKAIDTAKQIGQAVTQMGTAGDQAAKKVADATKQMTPAMQQATASAAAEAGAVDKLSASMAAGATSSARVTTSVRQMGQAGEASNRVIKEHQNSLHESTQGLGLWMRGIDNVAMGLEERKYVAAPKRLINILCYELPPAKDAVAGTAPWTSEGKRARARLWRIVERMRRIAKRHGESLVCHGVELVVGQLKAELPNLDDAGRLN